MLDAPTWRNSRRSIRLQIPTSPGIRSRGTSPSPSTLALVGCLLLAVVGGQAFGAILPVYPDGHGAYPTIQAAIDSALAGDVVELASGTFTGSGNRDLDFAGKAITVRSAAENPDSCALDLQRLGRGFYFHTSEDSTSIVRAIRIENGLPAADTTGGAIACVGASPRIENCVLAGNESVLGGAISCVGASPLLVLCRVTGNLASNGGALHADSTSAPLLYRCTLSSNHASATGGGIYSASDSLLSLTRTILYGNCADLGGAQASLASAIGGLSFSCSAVDSTGIDGPGIADYVANNAFADPAFCAPALCTAAPTTAGNYTLATGSPCEAASSPCALTIGAGAEGCIMPTGACCFPNGSCLVLTAADCSTQSGTYQGDATVCTPNPCPQPTGACCFPDGSCLVLTAADCTTQSGAYQGDATVCTPNPCPQPTGGCCFPNGSCLVLTAADCATQSGTYQGDATVCTPNPCPQPTGACCFPDGSCLVLTAADCATQSGTYQGDATVCIPNPCPQPTGACCFPDGSCLVLTAADCATQSGTYQGDSTVCAPNPCPQPTGACCFPNGTCLVLTAADCATQSGTYQGDSTVCTPNPCPQPTGACCFPNGSCLVLTAADCTTQSGAYQGDATVCTPNPCPQPTGACCFPDGSCLVLTAADCATQSGTYQGDGTTCTPNPCPQPTGACCFPNGSCLVLTAADCATQSGTYQGDATVCVPNPCPQPTGACCFPNGSCLVLTAPDCATQSGTYQGDSTACTPNPCPQPTGACCFPNGSCLVLTATDCAIQSGAYQGDATVCTPNPCPQPTGACCFPNGSCLVLTAADCATQSGTYQGDATVCTPNPCPQPTGACCFPNGSCLVLTAADCATQSGTYQGDGTTCTPNPCPQPTGACCFPNGSCLVLTAVDCATQIGIYQGDFTVCAPNPCPPPTGACCWFAGVCQVLSEAACADSTGRYLGDFSTCDPNPCPTYHIEPDGSGHFATIQAAIDASSSGAKIELGNGRYTGSGNTAIDFRGKALRLFAESLNPDSCYIDCDLSGRGLYFKTGETNTTIVEGIGIRNGFLTGTQRGAGIACVGASPWIRDCRVLGNESALQGGGIYCENASPRLTRCVITGNRSAQGAGLYARLDSAPLIESSTISGNEATERGGGIHSASELEIALDRVILDGNCAGLDGDEAYLFFAGISGLELTCCAVDDAGIEGPGPVQFVGPSLSSNPKFCAPLSCASTPTILGDYHLRADSPCLPEGSPCAALIGGLGAGCDSLPRGACCVPSGGCSTIEQGECSALGGTYLGDGIPCETANCPPGGACCYAMGACVVQTSAVCLSGGGSYSGDGVACDPYPCPPFLVRANGTGDFATIQVALDSVSNGAIIELAPGFYSGAGNRDLVFHGKAVTLRSETGDPRSCILDCQGLGRGFYFNGGEGPSTLVRGLTISRGRVTGAARGAGVACVASSPTFENCVITGQRSDGDGGAVYCFGASPTLRGCTLAGNAAARGGGLFATSGSTPQLERTILWGNCATTGGDELFIEDSGSVVGLSCSLIDSSGIGGAGDPQYGSANLFDDPIFCAPAACSSAPTLSGDYRLSSASPCLLGASPCALQIGALGQGCTTAVGACCIGSTCLFTLQATCAQEGGTYLGNGVPCVPAPCEVDGGCCLPDESCVQVTLAECAEATGHFLGAGVPCGPNGCSWNAGGILTAHATPGLVYTPSEDYCGTSILESCGNGVFSVAGADTVVFHIMAGFNSSETPRLAGVTFGVRYDSLAFALLDHGSCADVDLPESSWPASESGVALTWNTPRTTALTEVYWFAGYNRNPGQPLLFELIPHPVQGSYFADDSIPAKLDPVTCLGALGFDTPGTSCCATVAVESDPIVPATLLLRSIQPNPAQGEVTILYDLPARAEVELAIFTPDGRRIRTLEHGFGEPGHREVRWDRRNDAGSTVPAGVYFVRLSSRGREQVRKMLMLQ